MGAPLGKLVPPRLADRSGCPIVGWTVQTFDFICSRWRSLGEGLEVGVLPFALGKMKCPCLALWEVCPSLGPFSPGEAGSAWTGQVVRLSFALRSLTARAGPAPLGSSPCPHPSGKPPAMPSADPSAMDTQTDFFSEKLREHKGRARPHPKVSSRHGLSRLS